MTSDTIPTISANVVAVTPIPVGGIITYGGINLPDGWLLCDGAQISQATYPNLFAVVGGTLPDLRSRFIVGTGQGKGLSNYNLGATGGPETVVLTVGETPPHQHFGFGEIVSGWPFGYQGNNDKPGSNGGYATDGHCYYGTTTVGGGQAHENRPPYYALTYIIKY